MRITDRTNRIALKFAFCALSLLFLLPITRAADAFIKDVSSGCAVFKPNLKPGDAVKFKGSCANGFAHGPGVAMWGASDGTTVTFEGNFVQGKLLGNAKMTASGGDRYQGEYKDGKREGMGAYTSANGDRYDGQYKDNKRDGHGIQTLGTGGRTEGEWRNGTLISKTPNASPSTGLAGPKLGPSQPSTKAIMSPGPSLAQSPPLLSPSQAMAPKQPTPPSSPPPTPPSVAAAKQLPAQAVSGPSQAGKIGPAANADIVGLKIAKPLDQAIIGKWGEQDKPSSDFVEFFPDKTFQMVTNTKGKEEPMNGTWVVVGERRVKIDIAMLGVVHVLFFFENIEISGDRMQATVKFSNAAPTTGTFVRVK